MERATALELKNVFFVVGDAALLPDYFAPEEVGLQNKFIYPLEDFFTMYLSDYFDDSLFVIQGKHHLPFRYTLYHRFP